MKAITLYDVARVAGVSYQTVSRVINDAEHVSARTREKVRQAMAALHYVPNRGAQQLAGKRTRTLGLMTSDLALHAPSQIASAVKSRAGERGASVLISMVEQPAQWQAALQELLAQRVEALLVNVPLEDTQAEMLQEMARLSDGVLQFNTLYIAIYRLQEHGYISPSETVVTESNRTRVYFSITEQGSRYLDDIIAEYRRVTQTIDSLLSKDGVLYEGDSV